MRRKFFGLLGIVALLAMTFMLAAPAYAAVWTDKADYAPGEVVTISGDNSNGAGYQAGETVQVNVLGPNGYAASFQAVVGASGAWSSTVTLPTDQSAVGTYTYVAKGLTSGVTESGTFTDAENYNTSTTLNAITTPLTAGQTGVSFSGQVTTASPDLAGR